MSPRSRTGYCQRRKALPRSKNPCANPIFESWIIEWKEEAETKDSLLKCIYDNALNSLRKYPLPLSSGNECSILENFGLHMCKMIENRMAKENMFPGDLQSSASQGILDVITVSDEEPGPSSKITANKKKQRTTSVKKKIPVPNVDQEGLNDQLEIPEPQPSTSRKITTPKKKAKPIVKLPSHVEVVDLLGSDSESEPQPLSSYRVTAPKKKKKAGPTPAEVRIPIPGFDAQDFIETDTECEPEPTTSTKAVKQKGKQYLPAYRSGAYAILMALLKKECDADYRGYMTKSELQQDAQRYCDMSLTKPDSTKHSHYAAWNSMKILTNKELVMKRGNPVLFFLSPEGRSLARKLLDAESKDSQLQPPNGGVNAVTDYEVSSQDEEDCEVVSPNLPTNIRLEPGKFEIVLYIDINVADGGKKSRFILKRLQNDGVIVYIRPLTVGEFVWVCREVVNDEQDSPAGAYSSELIIPTFIERQKSHRLAHMVKTGRMNGKRYSLAKTRLQPVFVIETNGRGDGPHAPLDAATISLLMDNGFTIKNTSSIKDTCAYLTFMTRHLKDTYEKKTVVACTWDELPNQKVLDTDKEAHLMMYRDFENFMFKNKNWKNQVSSQHEDWEVVSPNFPTNIRLEPGKFEIVLYVDTCETNGKGKSQDVINELQKNGVTIYVHRLNIGDFVWVCREVADVSGNRNRLTMSRTNELILPYVVERKRTDDLAHSIRDGRFHEQKYRLTQTQLQPIYLIESYGKGDWGLAEGALDREIANTQIENGFLIQETSSIKDTCAYLTFMTRHLKDTYEHKTILGCRKDDWTNLRGVSTNTEAYMMLFSDFNDFSVKKTNWKVKEMFARHLMRLKGLSVDKAYAIIQKYPTLDDLLKTYSKCETVKEKESLLSQVEFGTSCRKIGPSISRKVYRFYNSTNL